MVSESRGQLLAVIGEELRVERSSRNGHVSHAVIEQVLGGQFCVYMDQHPIRSLSLAGMAGHGIAIVKMRMLVWIHFNRAPKTHLPLQSSHSVNGLDRS